MWLCRPRAPDPAASRISDAHSSCRRLQARATPGLGRAWAEVCMGEKLGGVAGAWRGARPWKVAHLIGRSGGGRREEHAARPWLGAGDWALVSIRVVSIRVVFIRVVSIRVATPRLTGAKAGRHEAPAQCTARVYLSAQGERAPCVSLSARRESTVCISQRKAREHLGYLSAQGLSAPHSLSGEGSAGKPSSPPFAWAGRRAAESPGQRRQAFDSNKC